MDGYVLQQLGNCLIYDERNYDTSSLHIEFTNLFTALTDEHKNIYETIMGVMHNQQGAVFFLHGYRGKLGVSNDSVAEIEIPRELLITSFDDPIVAIVDRESKDYYSSNSIDRFEIHDSNTVHNGL
ncbi:uncharacterized protein LOC131655742 [Vicia villosa]|uniref:uncharacterized protein LOC131655742 n=1 Tax=Vicia villosa TaxID=3911 RepID=UPI00273B3145|nr:uncharacterized protein LOC131655742 [Vicia villosa]